MKKIKGYFRSLVVIATLLLCGQWASGQSAADSLAKDDHNFISSIAAYSADMRGAILNVAQYPQVLIKLERIQAQSSQSFQDLISGYSREEQEKFYEVVRFPDLMDKMVGVGKNNPTEAKGLVRDLPAETQNRLMDVYNSHFRELSKINSIFQDSQASLQKVISPYPLNVQKDFQKVISKPEVMNLLTDNIDQTVSLGEDYQANPDEITQQLDSMNVQLASQNTEDLAAYKKEVASNPDMQREMKNAADEFSSSNSQSGTPTVVNNYYGGGSYYDGYPYSYWFSYPHWYSAPIWYPRPWYYYTGYYYGPSGLVVLGLPSMIYSHWFFGFGYRHYPLLYNRYNSYCYVHRVNIIHHYSTFSHYGRSSSGFSHAGSRPGRDHSYGRSGHSGNMNGGNRHHDWTNGGSRNSTGGGNRWGNIQRNGDSRSTGRNWTTARGQTQNSGIDSWSRQRQTQTNSRQTWNRSSVPNTTTTRQNWSGGSSQSRFSNPGNTARPSFSQPSQSRSFSPSSGGGRSGGFSGGSHSSGGFSGGSHSGGGFSGGSHSSGGFSGGGHSGGGHSGGGHSGGRGR